MRPARLLLVSLALITACSSASATTSSTTSSGVTRLLPVAVVPGYTLTEFTRADSRLVVSNPDSVEVDQGHVFIDYQNVTAKDCTDLSSAAAVSTVVQYDMTGKILGHWNVAGHSDGMRIDPTTHLVWTTSCEDGNPQFATIDSSTGTVTPYKVPTPPHGGGYDDLFFLGGSVFIAASNPTLDSDGANPNPAIDKIALNADKTLTLTPVLMGNAMAADLLSNNSPTQLTLTDPDSMTVDANGSLVLVSQADNVIVYIVSPGTPSQKVSKLSVGTQLDDTVFPTGPGRLLVVDAGGITYWMDGPFAKGDIWTQSPNDSGVVNFVGTVSPTTGFVTPLAVGFTKTTGMLFVPKA